MASFKLIVGAALLAAQSALAQISSSDIIWGSVIFSRHGERTPLIAPTNNVLTPLGAQQLLSSGSFFRDRYVSPPDSSDPALVGIAANTLDSTQVVTISTPDQFIEGSAQAFLQGLYPPASSSGAPSSISTLANGSSIDYPLGGYQYPQIYTGTFNASELDPNSIFIAGDINCPAFADSGMSTFNTEEFQQTRTSTQAFYSTLRPLILSGDLTDLSVGYENAYDIFDYFNYEYAHNLTLQSALSSETLFQLQTLSDRWEYSLYGNHTPGAAPNIHTVAGQTMAADVVGLLLNNINSNGFDNKLNLLFSSFEPMISFAALAELPSIDQNFYGLPDYGSAMVFEMFSSNGNSTSYPGPDDLFVRFLFRNGTNETAELVPYPLFGLSPSQTDLRLNDFFDGMQDIMLDSIASWCTLCQSSSVFCAGYLNSTKETSSNTTTSGSPTTQTSAKHALAPAVSGVIGAIIALVLAALIFAALMLLGFRISRNKEAGIKIGNISGGFKAREKMASDPDLTKTKAGSSVVTHERIGSWELGEAMKKKDLGVTPRRPSYEDDGISIHNYTEGTKPNETV